jgi:triacylglycerol lipase
MATAAAADVAEVGSAIGAANATAAAPTTGLLAAAEDEVSTAIAALFSGHGQGFQVLSAQAALFHDRFVQTLTGASGAYAAAEASQCITAGGVRADGAGH